VWVCVCECVCVRVCMCKFVVWFKMCEVGTYILPCVGRTESMLV